MFVLDDEDDEKKLARIAAEAAARVIAAQKHPSTKGLGIFQASPRMAAPLGYARWNAPLGAIQFGNKTADSKVLEVQKWLNTYLKKFGYSTIDQDGLLGKGTCGACAWSFGQEIDFNTAPASFWEVWAVCATSSQSAPVPLTATAKNSAYTQGVTAMQSKPLDTAAVMEAQRTLNSKLTAAGMCAIGVDGKAGSETCGAQAWLIANAGGDGLTQAQRDAIYPKCSVGDKTAPASCAAAATAPPVPIIPTGPMPTETGAPKISAATMLAGVGVMAVLGVAWYLYSHKKAAGG